MGVRNSGNSKISKKKKEFILLILLGFSMLLFILCLSAIISAYMAAEKNAAPTTTLSSSVAAMITEKNSLGLLGASDELNDPEVNISDSAGKSTESESVTRDEFQPEINDLLKERELSRKKVETLFGKMNSPKDIASSHTTYGKEVVYIYHSHNREAFVPYLKDIEQPEEAYHAEANITLVGKMLGRALERRGVGTTVDSTDIVQELGVRGLNYGSSYHISGEYVKTAQKKNKDLEIFLDVHRDSLRKASTTLEIDGEDYARLLFVVGTGHENFEKNLAFSEGLHNLFAAQYPGLSKGILKKDGSQGNGVYNQHLSPKSVIVEIGGVDNTAEELHRTVEVLADVLSDYYWHGEQ